MPINATSPGTTIGCNCLIKVHIFLILFEHVYRVLNRFNGSPEFAPVYQTRVEKHRVTEKRTDLKLADQSYA